MKAKEKFLEMFYKLPKEAKKELICNPYTTNPMTLNILFLEVKNNTKLGKIILDKLGYKDD